MAEDLARLGEGGAEALAELGVDDAVRAQILELLGTGTSTEEISGQLGVPRGTVVAMKGPT